MDLCPLDNNTVEVSGGVNGKLAGGVRTKVKPVNSQFQDQIKVSRSDQADIDNKRHKLNSLSSFSFSKFHKKVSLGCYLTAL